MRLSPRYAGGARGLSRAERIRYVKVTFRKLDRTSRTGRRRQRANGIVNAKTLSAGSWGVTQMLEVE